jgi:hypothetical protein
MPSKIAPGSLLCTAAVVVFNAAWSGEYCYIHPLYPSCLYPMLPPGPQFPGRGPEPTIPAGILSNLATVNGTVTFYR